MSSEKVKLRVVWSKGQADGCRGMLKSQIRLLLLQMEIREVGKYEELILVMSGGERKKPECSLRISSETGDSKLQELDLEGKSGDKRAGDRASYSDVDEMNEVPGRRTEQTNTFFFLSSNV